MGIIFASVTISMSEFKKNPAAVLREAGSVKEPLRKLLEKRLDKPPVPGAALHGALKGMTGSNSTGRAIAWSRVCRTTC